MAPITVRPARIHPPVTAGIRRIVSRRCPSEIVQAVIPRNIVPVARNSTLGARAHERFQDETVDIELQPLPISLP